MSVGWPSPLWTLAVGACLFASLAGPAAAGDEASPTAELFARMKALYSEIEYESAVEIGQDLLQRTDATPEMLEEIYLMLGSSLAAVGDPSEAETPFRLLLRLRPDFEMPEDISPKILAVFRLVQTEERKIAERMAALEREKLVASLELEGGPPLELLGGQPIGFKYRLRDPRGVIETVSVRFRRQNEAAFSALALALGADNRWRGEIPGEWSNNEGGFELEYYVAAADRTGDELLGLANKGSPLRVPVSPGEAGELVVYEEWWFWTIVGVVAAGATVGAVFLYDQSVQLPESDRILWVP